MNGAILQAFLSNSKYKVANSLRCHNSHSPSPKATQYKVARIAEEFHAGNDASLVFDLRSSPMTPDANICAIHYFIGDDDAVDLEHTTAEVRAVVQELPDHSAMHNILLDSGADASVFPMCFASAGEPSCTGNMKLHDAQGKQIPVAGMRDVEIALLDEHGRLVTFRERGAVSPGVFSAHHLFWQTFGKRLWS